MIKAALIASLAGSTIAFSPNIALKPSHASITTTRSAVTMSMSSDFDAMFGSLFGKKNAAPTAEQIEEYCRDDESSGDA